MEFIEYIQRSSNNAIFLNQNDALDFLRRKSAVRVREWNGQLQVENSEIENDELKIFIQYGTHQYPLSAGGVTL
jgi:hypothetical protein